MTAWRSREGRRPDGRWPIVFKPAQAMPGEAELKLPCGQCINCRLERSRQWAMRCVHESKMHEKNCFVTLTYDDVHLVRCKSGSLNKRDFVLFMKRLRKKYGDGIRFFHCGEYGEMLNRPHHHVCLFNHDFDDKELWSVRGGVKLYRSKELEILWPYGYSTIGEVTFESAAYVARYCTKKLTGEGAKAYYNGREPEYITMSRRPGIGREWFAKYYKDVYSFDYVVVRGIECRPPKYYDGLYDVLDKVDFEKLKLKRKEKLLLKDVPKKSVDRTIVNVTVAELKLKNLKRNLEKGQSTLC